MSVAGWRLSFTNILYLVLLGLSISAALPNSDNSYNKYELEGTHQIKNTPIIELKSLRRSKHSAILPQIQPPSNENNGTISSLPTASNPDRDVVVKDTDLLDPTKSKTGGNYHTEVTSAVGLPSTDASKEKFNKKWLDAVGKLGKKVAQDESDLLEGKLPTESSTTGKSIPIPTPEIPLKTTDNTKSDGKPMKKVETETKPPKLEPTKVPISNDKSSKKAATDEKVQKSSTEKTDEARNETSTSSTMDTGEQESVPIANFPQEASNKTLTEHNITNTVVDYHQYYNSTFLVNNPTVGLTYWVNMTDRPDVQTNGLLSQSHRRAATVHLSFDFPFYGHNVRNVTIATGGFLYTGEYVHSWLAATQYIAPLMANFDTSISNLSYVKHVDNGTAFTVQWENVVLQDRPTSGDFTFQVTLFNTGDIVFVYQKVPVVIESILDDNHPVKVGLSDAYIIDRTIFFVRRKTIYEYHRVNFERQDIKNWTVIFLTALPTCLDVKDCTECLTHSSGFTCNWCPGSKRCSNGMDRYRQEWLLKGCDRSSISSVSDCPASSHSSALPVQPADMAGGASNAFSDKHSLKEQETTSSSIGVFGIIGILLLLALVFGMPMWVLYSYRNPLSASGQFLIRYRPSTWSWRRGEARYTAATIHM